MTDLEEIYYGIITGGKNDPEKDLFSKLNDLEESDLFSHRLVTKKADKINKINKIDKTKKINMIKYEDPSMADEDENVNFFKQAVDTEFFNDLSSNRSSPNIFKSSESSNQSSPDIFKSESSNQSSPGIFKSESVADDSLDEEKDKKSTDDDDDISFDEVEKDNKLTYDQMII